MDERAGELRKEGTEVRLKGTSPPPASGSPHKRSVASP